MFLNFKNKKSVNPVTSLSAHTPLFFPFCCKFSALLYSILEIIEKISFSPSIPYSKEMNNNNNNNNDEKRSDLLLYYNR